MQTDLILILRLTNVNESQKKMSQCANIDPIVVRIHSYLAFSQDFFFLGGKSKS